MIWTPFKAATFGVEQLRGRREKKGSACGVMLYRIRPTALFVFLLAGFVIFGNRYFSKGGKSLLACLAYFIVFGIAVCNLVALVAFAASEMALKYGYFK